MALYLDRVWHVGLVNAPIQRFLEPGFQPAIAWLPRPAFSEFLADPFGVVHRGQLTVFAEAYDYGTGRGRIVCIRKQGEGWSKLETAFAPSHHVSFPFVVEAQGSWFCLPEQWQTGELTLHELDLDNGRVGKVVTRVARIDAVDPVCFQHAGRYWVLTTDRRGQYTYAYSATSLFGPYLPHPRNPVLSGPFARNAGSVFEANGKLFRPAMCNRRRYGHAIELREIVELSELHYRERAVTRIDPWDREYALGFHTLAGVGELTLVDGLRPSWAPGRLRALCAPVRA